MNLEDRVMEHFDEVVEYYIWKTRRLLIWAIIYIIRTIRWVFVKIINFIVKVILIIAEFIRILYNCAVTENFVEEELKKQ